MAATTSAIASLAGAGASLYSAFNGGGGSPRSFGLAKNKQLKLQINNAIKDYDTVHNTSQSALQDYISRYFKNEETARGWGNQEFGNIDKYYTGGAASELAALRRRRREAMMDAANRAVGYTTGNMNRSRASQDGGPSSYDRRLYMRNIGDILAQVEADDTAQERADWNMLEQAKLGFTGQRQNLANANAAYRLRGEEMRRQVLGQDVDLLQALTGANNSNTQYGVNQGVDMTADRIRAAGSALGALGQTFGGGFRPLTDNWSDMSWNQQRQYTNAYNNAQKARGSFDYSIYE